MESIKVVILTQDDPFYLADELDYLLNNLPKSVKVSGCVIFDVSPFGKKESIIQKAFKTARIFGFLFFLRYGVKFILSKLNYSKSIDSILEKHAIEKIDIEGSINSE